VLEVFELLVDDLTPLLDDRQRSVIGYALGTGR
jgi:hypothetical protein